MNQPAWEAPTSMTESLESRQPFILASPRELRKVDFHCSWLLCCTHCAAAPPSVSRLAGSSLYGHISSMWSESSCGLVADN